MSASEEKLPQNILLTGGAGFIGSWIADQLIQENRASKLVIVDKLSYCSSVLNLEAILDSPNVHFVKGDVCNLDLINEVVSRFEITTILHFAGESSVDNSFNQGIAFTQANTLGTQTLLEVARTFRHQITRFIYFSTDEVYGDIPDDSPGVDEAAALAPTNPYSASKAAGDLLALSYAKSFDIPVVIFRCCNVYGPRQYPEKLISGLATSLDERRAFTLHGDGSNKRCYVYVEDVASAVIKVMSLESPAVIYNLATNDEMSNLELTKKICDMVEKPSAIIKFGPDRPYNDRRYAMAFDRLTATGWVPKKSLEEGLKETLEWYEKQGAEWWYQRKPTIL